MRKVHITLNIVEQVLRVRANHYVPIKEISAGDIVALSGMK